MKKWQWPSHQYSPDSSRAGMAACPWAKPLAEAPGPPALAAEDVERATDGGAVAGPLSLRDGTARPELGARRLAEMARGVRHPEVVLADQARVGEPVDPAGDRVEALRLSRMLPRK